jgi:hypothetical protein
MELTLKMNKYKNNANEEETEVITKLELTE